jgi:uncharacterized protein YdaU (DUF1376 family)
MTRRSMPYHRRYHGDALQGYMVLTLEEKGAYTVILDLIYDRAGPIDRNERYLAGMFDCTAAKARKLVDALAAKRKIYITAGGQISNRRCEQEIEASLTISAKRAESAAKRGEKISEFAKKANAFNASGLQMQSKRVAKALHSQSISEVIHSAPQEAVGDAVRAGRDLQKTLKNSRKSAKKHSENDPEFPEIYSKNNDAKEQMQSDCSVIPEPYIYNTDNLENNSAREAEEGSGRDLSYLVDLIEKKQSGRTPHPPSPAGRIPGARRR